MYDDINREQLPLSQYVVDVDGVPDLAVVFRFHKWMKLQKFRMILRALLDTP